MFLKEGVSNDRESVCFPYVNIGVSLGYNTEPSGRWSYGEVRRAEGRHLLGRAPRGQDGQSSDGGRASFGSVQLP